MILVGIVAYFYSDTITNFSKEVPQKVEEISADIPIPTQDEISKTIEKASESVSETISSVTTISELDTQSTALKIHDLINEQRSSYGLRTFGWHPTIAQIATGHSQDMAQRDYFSHDSPEGHDFVYRYSQTGFHCQVAVSATMYYTGAENIFFLEGYYGEDRIAQTVVDGWMQSEGHRQNILTPEFQNEGIGIALSNSGKVYVTQNFC